MSSIEIRPMTQADIPAAAQMEYDAWHDYYKQYTALYDTIASSVTLAGITKDWSEFISDHSETSGPLVTGQDRIALIALIDGHPAGVAAASAYVEGKWPEVDEQIRKADGTLPKLTKYQNLYIHKDHRGAGLGHHLNIARADDMLARGYTGLFLTTYADAHKTNAYHETRSGMTRVHDYMSMQTYNNSEKARIACFLNEDLQGLRDQWATYLDQKIKDNRAFPRKA